jgi:beta-phosphoglucomutase-like phosphatase (HAD superfamily)
MRGSGLIYDFDGVIADSEALANTVLAETITSLGRPTTLDEALDRYMGKRWPEVITQIESDLGRALPNSFSEDLKMATLERFSADLREVQGASSFIRHFHDIPRCIASSSSLDRLHTCLKILGLANEFGTHVYSADMVERGKPHPDIFVLAAQKLNIPPSDCIVIEDSSSGVRAGVAAGMIVIGLCAGSHLRSGHARRLIDAGATHTASTWGDALAIVEHALNGGFTA